MSLTIKRTKINGIERITYLPDEQRYQTPIVFQHGAWHGAWCWHFWQELFAEWGWVSHAHSLPQHGESRTGRNIRLCTLGYYRDVLREQVQHCETKPVVVGHSMGGAITQWYISKWDDLPAAILLASMPRYDNIVRYILADPLGMLMASLILHGKPLVRTPQHVRALFLSDNALMSPEELHRKMAAESLLVPLQLNPISWHPKRNPDTPMLVMAAELDTIFTLKEQHILADLYAAEYYLMENTAHNAMMEHCYRVHAEYLQNWLLETGIS